MSEEGITVRGGAKFAMVGKQLKAAGLEGRGLRKELLAEIRVAAKPMAQAAKKAAIEELPKSGGMNTYYGSGGFTVRNRLTGNAGIRIVGTKKNHSMKQADSGTVKHPVFGNRAVWSSTKTKAGWFEDALRPYAPAVRAAVLLAMKTTLDKIGK